MRLLPGISLSHFPRSLRSGCSRVTDTWIVTRAPCLRPGVPILFRATGPLSRCRGGRGWRRRSRGRVRSRGNGDPASWPKPNEDTGGEFIFPTQAACPRGGDLILWMSVNYIATTASAIRRLGDRRRIGVQLNKQEFRCQASFREADDQEFRCQKNSRPGRPGWLPTQVPHRSGLAHHAHPVPHLMNSRPARSVVGTWTWFRSRCTCQVSLQRLMRRHPLPLTGFLGLVPPLQRYYEVLRLPAAHFAALRFLRLAIPSLRPLFVPLGPGRGAVDQSGVGRRYLQPPCSMETTGSPKFPEEPL